MFDNILAILILLDRAINAAVIQAAIERLGL
jgi:hypothetical protein